MDRTSTVVDAHPNLIIVYMVKTMDRTSTVVDVHPNLVIVDEWIRYDIPSIVEDVVMLDFTDVERAFYREARGNAGTYRFTVKIAGVCVPFLSLFCGLKWEPTAQPFFKKFWHTFSLFLFLF